MNGMNKSTKNLSSNKNLMELKTDSSMFKINKGHPLVFNNINRGLQRMNIIDRL